MSRCARQSAGFTLMELLVAMTLMMVAASCLYTALYTGFRAHRSATSAVEPTSLALNAIELLKQDILGVLPPGDGLAGAFIGTDSAGFQGVDTDELIFYTTQVFADNDQIAGGIAMVELLLKEDPDGDKDYDSYLLLRRVTTNLLAPKEVEPDEQVLCRHVVSLNLRYFDGESWVDAWDSTEDANSLPQAVEIDIQVAHNGRNGHGAKEPQKRRLVQSFAIPCKTAAAEEEAESAR